MQTIAVIRGGPSRYDASLRSGAAVMAALNPEKFSVRDVVVSRDSFWHHEGTPMTPESALRGADLVFSCVRGRYGEDGWLHHLLASLGHRFVGSRPGSIAVAYHREKAKQVATSLGIAVPAHKILLLRQDLDVVIRDAFRSFPMPAVVKPLQGSAGADAVIVTDIVSLEAAVRTALAHASGALLEEMIAGNEASAGIIDGLPGTSPHAFVWGSVSSGEQEILKDLAWRLHQAFGLSHYSVSHFMVGPRGVWYLGTNALPELAPESRFVQGLEKHGVSMPEFVNHVVKLAQTN